MPSPYQLSSLVGEEGPGFPSESDHQSLVGLEAAIHLLNYLVNLVASKKGVGCPLASNYQLDRRSLDLSAYYLHPDIVTEVVDDLAVVVVPVEKKSQCYQKVYFLNYMKAVKDGAEIHQ